jgi:hypothetical protein
MASAGLDQVMRGRNIYFQIKEHHNSFPNCKPFPGLLTYEKKKNTILRI